MTNTQSIARSRPVQAPTNCILHGDCVTLMGGPASASADFALTDPPYLVRYRDRAGRTIANDNNGHWLLSAVTELHRVLKDGSFCISFYGWDQADQFITAWRRAGFRLVGHVVFRKRYGSSTRFLEHRHEQAYLLAKGYVVPPVMPFPDVLDWRYTDNKLYPTQKPLEVLRPFISTFTQPGDLVLDPFCGSGSTLVAARELGRNFLGMELDGGHHRTACQRLGCPLTVSAA